MIYYAITTLQCDLLRNNYRLTNEAGKISDGIGNYSLNTKCSWLLIGRRSQTIRLRLLMLSTECGWDHLYIYDGDSVQAPLVAVFRFAEQSTPSFVSVKLRQFWVENVLIFALNSYLSVHIICYSKITLHLGEYNLTFSVP